MSAHNRPTCSSCGDPIGTSDDCESCITHHRLHEREGEV